MLDYEWGNPAAIMLSGGDDPNNTQVDPDQTRQNIYDHHHYASPQQFSDTAHAATNLIPQNNAPAAHLFHHPTTHHHNQVNSFFDPRAFPNPSSYAAPNHQHHHPSFLSLDAVSSPAAAGAGASYFLVPKTEDVSRHADFTSRIGLNLGLGGRTYFSSAEDDFVNRLYRRSRPVEPGASNAPRCQAEGCNADLTHAKHYHRRHKVCEFHSKASTVIAAGLTQRFCQQCSRFHLLSEFDNGKRSCRKRLADHNRRRRKSHQTNQENHKSQLDAALNSSENLTRSPPESGTLSSSSVTAAVSPPRMSLDCFKQRPYNQATTSSSTSSSSLFFSSG